jgi:hypothetical protein
MGKPVPVSQLEAVLRKWDVTRQSVVVPEREAEPVRDFAALPAVA